MMMLAKDTEAARVVQTVSDTRVCESREGEGEAERGRGGERERLDEHGQGACSACVQSELRRMRTPRRHSHNVGGDLIGGVAQNKC